MNFCGSDKKYTDTPQWFDPLGPNQQGQNGPTGGPEARNRIFNYIGGQSDQWMNNAQRAGQALKTAAGDPAWAALQQEAGKTGAGGYLGGSPAFDQIFSNYRNSYGNRSGVTSDTLNGKYLDSNIPGTDWAANQGGAVTQKELSGGYLNSAPQMRENVDPMLAGVRQRSQAEAADTNANIRSSMNRTGLGFSTANQQAQQANSAASSAQSNATEAATRLQAQQAADQARISSYLTERGLQSNAASQEDAAKRALNATKSQNYMQERGIQSQTAANEDAAGRHAADTEAGSRTGQYGQERALQTQAANQLNAAYASPLNYLSQSASPEMNQLSQIAQMVQGLSGSGQIATPNSTIVKQPGVYDYALGTLGALNV